MDSGRKFDAAARAAEKARSRQDDEIALATGVKTREDLRRENGIFVFPDAQILLSKAKRLS